MLMKLPCGWLKIFSGIYLKTYPLWVNVRSCKDWKREAKTHPCMFQYFEFAQFKAKDFATMSVALIVDPRVCLQVMVLRTDISARFASSNDLVCGAILASQEPFILAYILLFQIFLPKRLADVGRGNARLSLSQHTYCSDQMFARFNRSELRRC